jgi:phytoene dehydrogenase-like protein
MGAEELRAFLRLALANVADVLDEALSDDRLKGAVAFDTVLGAHAGPRSPNSLMLLYNRLAGQAAGQPSGLALPKGGMGALAAAMARAAAAAGATLRTRAAVAAIDTDGDRACGVTLADGERIAARRVISAANPRTTFFDLVGARRLDAGFVRRVRAIRMRGVTAKLHLGLSCAPDFRGADLRTRLLIAPSLDAVEAAFDPAKYGEAPEAPVIEAVIPSAFEEGLAPPGRHVLSAIVQCAPYALNGGWEAGRAAFLDRALAMLEAYAPGLRASVAAAELVTPPELEARYGLVGGDWSHGELAVERMAFLRPVIGAAHYATPVPDLWLGGAGCHPGGGVSGAAGWNAAERILAEDARG